MMLSNGLFLSVTERVFEHVPERVLAIVKIIIGEGVGVNVLAVFEQYATKEMFTPC